MIGTMQPDENRAAISYAYRGVQTACTYWIITNLEPATRMSFSTDLQDQARDNTTVVPASVKQVDHAPRPPSVEQHIFLAHCKRAGEREAGVGVLNRLDNLFTRPAPSLNQFGGSLTTLFLVEMVLTGQSSPDHPCSRDQIG